MTKHIEMTQDEKALLLFLETCHVDHGGLIRLRNMNDADHKIAERWNVEGFVSFGRLASECCTNGYSHWCQLGSAAFEIAHRERQERARRLWEKRTWRTTAEKRAS